MNTREGKMVNGREEEGGKEKGRVGERRIKKGREGVKEIGREGERRI